MRTRSVVSMRFVLLRAPLFGVALGAGACEDGSHSAPARTEPREQAGREMANLAPLDLVYVCGNKFLATNSTPTQAHLTYRVAGTAQYGGITLPPGPADDPGYSETELETTAGGPVELYRGGERLVRRRNEGLPCGPRANMAAAAFGAAEAGSWSAVFSWPVVAVHLSLLRDGRVLSWGNAGQPYIWDPASGEFTEASLGSELFCAGHSFLPDGRLMVAGGHIGNELGLPDINLFSPETGTWTPSTPMRRGRWYPTNTTLANGSVLIIAGTDQFGDDVAEPEVWTQSGGVRELSGASLVLPYYPRTFLAPNGQVFYAGEQQATRYLNTSGAGSWAKVADRRYGSRSYGTAVMYEAGKVLYAGGGRTTNTAEIIDLNAGAPTWQWTGSMALPRRMHNATVLPTGEVLVTGGTSGTLNQDLTQAIRAAEVWDPATGSWTLLASNAVNRAYHSTSLLLPDGRVLHAGSGNAAGMPDERNAELFSPPYLSKGPRPVIADAPSAVGYGGSFRIETPQADEISRISLIRLGSVTHAADMNQRLAWLAFTRQAGALDVSAPGAATEAPPGHYMLFLLDGAGVPSVARIVKLGSVSEPPPDPNTAPTAAFIVGCSGSTCNFADRSTDADGNLADWAWDFGDGRQSSGRDPTHVFDAAGTFSVRLTARDGDGASTSVSRQVGVPGQSAPITLTLTTRSNSTTQFVDLSWSRAQGPGMYVYRNGVVIASTPNDGRHTISRTYTGSASYIFRLCEAATTICSNLATAVFGAGSTPPNTPPNAVFTADCVDRTCRFADGSLDRDGTVTAWLWDFGDGTSSSQRHPSRTYAGGGVRTATLTVTDNLGAQGSASRQVGTGAPQNSVPTAAFTSSCTDLSCSFTDGSTDPDGEVVDWSWDFGDGASSAARNPVHDYAAGGTYAVTLTVRDDGDAEASATGAVSPAAPGSNLPPDADFASSCTGLTCSFTDLSTDADGNVTGWQWTFGDGATSTSRNPSRTYSGAGTYTVTLDVTDDRGGAGQHSAPVTVTAPAGFTLTATGRTDATRHFLTYNWNGASGSTVDLWRNGTKLLNTANDGSHTYSRKFVGRVTYVLKVCRAGSKTNCSNEVTVTLSN